MAGSPVSDGGAGQAATGIPGHVEASVTMNLAGLFEVDS
jgi:hypothetical protein